MNYSLEIIPGTKRFVLAELLQKFPEVEIILERSNRINFSSKLEDIDDFRTLLSPLRITKENGLTRNLFRRDWKVASSPAGINPALAYILCQMCKIEEGTILYDPFCGAGTIPITAGLYFKPKKVLASDVSGKAIDLCIKNFKAAKLSKFKYSIFRSNISQISFAPETIDYIITNLPFGIRVGNHTENIKSYQMLKNKAAKILKKGGKLILYTQEKNLIKEIFEDKRFELSGNFDIAIGGLIPSVYSFMRSD